MPKGININGFKFQTFAIVPNGGLGVKPSARCFRNTYTVQNIASNTLSPQQWCICVRICPVFIKAEIMSFDDLKKYGTELKVKEAGKLRLEGKDYVMQDGDICHFRFNV